MLQLHAERLLHRDNGRSWLARSPLLVKRGDRSLDLQGSAFLMLLQCNTTLFLQHRDYLRRLLYREGLLLLLLKGDDLLRLLSALVQLQGLLLHGKYRRCLLWLLQRDIVLLLLLHLLL